MNLAENGILKKTKRKHILILIWIFRTICFEAEGYWVIRRVEFSGKEMTQRNRGF